MVTNIPTLVADAQRRAGEIDFSASSDEIVGGLLASLSMAVPFGGRILEIGTGAGVGCAWIVS
jgi:demethylmenaquinone methyltransferase/2-methoxy-6-polyprenyl-1,4-benzoquinol methylase